jgi:NDP-sugar pyrophosphorylase family protein
VRPAPSPARIPVAILAGGAGSRLRAVIGERQKVVAEVAGRPFLAHGLDRLDAAGFRDAVLCVGYRADEVEARLGTAHGGLRLRYSREETPLGTAGALRRALPLLEGDPVLVLNGDSFCAADLAAFCAWHVREGSDASLVVVPREDATRYGLVEVDAEGSVLSFAEKQPGAGAGWINAGIYLLARERLVELPTSVPLSLERDVLPAWVGRGLRAWRSDARFLDIGTDRSYAGASAFFDPGEARAKP